MRSTILALTASAIAAVSAPALAQDAPASDLTISGGATVVTDYRFRGVSQTNKNFAVQGTLTATHESGFYVGTWGSTIDDYVANGSDQEIDLYAGYSRAFGGATVDVGVLYYYYPGSGGIASDFFEPYASVKGTVGPVTAKLGVAYAPKQHAIAWNNNRDDNLYVYGDVSGALLDTGITLSAHAGQSSGRSYLTGGLKNYWDWNVGASYTWENLTFGVTYVDTDIKKSNAFFTSPTNRKVAKAGVFGSIGVSF